MNQWIRLMRAEVVGDTTQVIETENFQKCQDLCEKDEECRVFANQN